MIQKNVLKDAWRDVDFSEFWNDQLERPEKDTCGIEPVVCCNIPNLDTDKRMIVNGFGDTGKLVIPDDAQLQKPIQIQSVVKSDRKALVEVNSVIEVGKNAHVQIIHCDDTIGEMRSLSNNKLELIIGENSHVEYYKLQNLNNQSGLINQTIVTMQANARLNMNCITLNGGHICNHAEVRMMGEGCEVEANGLYLLDREQLCDNYIFVEHAFPHCNSHELYKGIIDDQARATFNGHVLVQDHAVKTEAYQTNRNILMNDKAHVQTKPFLEIYNDDVKCSHGSTIGQLDELALFYIRSRGISERSARTLLLYAFCDEVLQKIEIPALRERLSDMVKSRLHGELTACSDCALSCSTPCSCPDATFHIDTSKL